MSEKLTQDQFLRIVRDAKSLSDAVDTFLRSNLDGDYDAEYAIALRMYSDNVFNLLNKIETVPDVKAGIVDTAAPDETWIPVGDILDVVSNDKWSWVKNTKCKYVNITLDTRNGNAKIADRDGNPISIAQLEYQYASTT